MNVPVRVTKSKQKQSSLPNSFICAAEQEAPFTFRAGLDESSNQIKTIPKQLAFWLVLNPVKLILTLISIMFPGIWKGVGPTRWALTYRRTKKHRLGLLIVTAGSKMS